MPKGQKKLQETATQRSNEQYQTGKEAQQRLIDGSPEFKAYQERTNARRASINNGTFAQSKDFLSNRDAVAARTAQREGQMNTAKTGFGALATRYADPNQIALTDRVMRDEFARDSAMQAESDKRQFISETQAMESDVIGKKLGVDTTIMGTGFGQSGANFDRAAQIAASRASIVPGIIGGLISGFGSAMTGGMSGALSFGARSAPSVPRGSLGWG